MSEDYRMIVIADDITGAAEIAGIAHSHGLRVRLLCNVVGEASKLCINGAVVGEASKLCTVVGETSQLCSIVGEASKLCTVVGEASKLCTAGEASKLCTVVGEASKLCSTVGEASKLCSIVGEASKLCSTVGEASKLCSTVGEASKLCSTAGEASKLCCRIAVGEASQLCNPAGEASQLCDVLVIATDTRSMTAEEAAEETRHIAENLSSHSSLFKKTDSALRGHVVAELKTLMTALSYHRAVYLPANPSKGRIIRNGVYYIREVRGEGQEDCLVPLHATAFSYDPEFPARSSTLSERFPDAAGNSIIMPDAGTADDIRSVITRYDDGHTLFAGAADLFKAQLQALSLKATPPRSQGMGTSTVSPCAAAPHPGSGRDGGRDFSSLLILCGSTQSKPQATGLAESPMPLSVYDGSDDVQAWLADALPKYQTTGSLMLTIPHHHRTGRAAAIHLRTVMAAMARHLVGHDNTGDVKLGSFTHYGTGDAKLGSFTHYGTVDAKLGNFTLHLVIEGGATAWATLQALGWRNFDIVGELAPGIVQMRADNGVIVTLKPGSYPWGNLNAMIRNCD